MSTFGEIVEPGTRTAWEDWDENIQEESHPKLQWLEDVNVPAQIHTIFILEGRQLANNISTLNNLKLECVNSIPEVHLKLYRAEDSDVYVCALKDYSLLWASEIIELLKPYLSVSSDVIAVLTKPLVEYKAMNVAQEYVIRRISTSKPVPASLVNNIPKLEQPNIISGVVAGVIGLREILNQAGAAIICYLEHNEEYQMSELQELLKKLNFGPAQSQPSTIFDSNLYI